MGDDRLLLLFSMAFIVVTVVVIVWPYLLRTHDLLTARNIFLVGSIVFVGLSGINATITRHYFDYQSIDYLYFYAGITLFYFVFLFAYHFLEFPRRLGHVFFQHWPTPGWGVTIVMVVLTIALNVSARAFFIPFVSQILFWFAASSLAYVVALAFALWWRSKANLLALVLFLAVLIPALVVSVSLGSGRRPLVSALGVIPLSLYWYWLRYQNPLKVSMLFGLAGFFFLWVIAGHSLTRHSALMRPGGSRFENSLHQLMRIPGNMSKVNPVRELPAMGQDAVDVSLWCVSRHRKGEGVKWFDSVFYVVTNPIPRSFWENKPTALGFDLGQELIPDSGFSVGPGIVGHSVHDGGMLVLVVYALIYAVTLRTIDEFITSQPSNPFMIGFLATITGNVMMLPRGDIGIIGIQLVCAFVFTLLIQGVAMLLFRLNPTAYPYYRK